MLNNRMFQELEFKDALFADINQYIKDRENKWFKQTGINRARYLKEFIEKIMLEQEQLTATQLMWRLYSYATMAMGDGPLGTSKDLRVVILDRMCTSLGVNKDVIKEEISSRLASEVAYAASAANHAPYYIDEYKIRAEVKAANVRTELVKKPAAAAQNASQSTQKLMNLLLVTIEGYIFKSTHSGWFTRWLTREGVERAEYLKKYIINQLVIKERLNDHQLFARMLEMTSQFGQGVLGNSRDLRNELLKTMCCWNELHLDQDAINKVIDFRSEPEIHPDITGMGGGYIYVPDSVMESIRYRSEVLRTAKNKLFSNHQIEEKNRVGLKN